jgi:hypothetical protein
VSVGIVLTHVVAILGNGFVRGQPFKPDVVVVMQAGLIVIDEDGSGDMHGIYKAKAFFYFTLAQALLYLGADVDQRPSGRNLKPQLFSITFHYVCLQADCKVQFEPRDSRPILTKEWYCIRRVSANQKA